MGFDGKTRSSVAMEQADTQNRGEYLMLSSPKLTGFSGSKF
jgi:hypothetical protein